MTPQHLLFRTNGASLRSLSSLLSPRNASATTKKGPLMLLSSSDSRNPRQRNTFLTTRVALSTTPKRYFFSFFGGDDETKDATIERQPNNNNNNNHDGTLVNPNLHPDQNWEDYYRRPITPELWKEFRHERKRTRQYLSSFSSSPTDYRDLAREIQTNVNEIWASSSSPPPEYGPTGRWAYRYEWMADDDDNDNDNDSDAEKTVQESVAPSLRRVYQRYPTVEHNGGLSAADEDQVIPQQLVLELEHANDEIRSMSLTPDETCIASLIASETSAELRIREIDSGTETIVSTADLLQTVVATTMTETTPNPPTDIVGLEWGPNLPISHEGGYHYSLYLVLADGQGRPDRIVLCKIDPATLSLAADEREPVVPIYHSLDHSVMVDVQRTKGCTCVAIRADTKRSSEIFLSPPPPTLDGWLVPVRPRQDGVVYHVDVGADGDVVLLTSDERSTLRRRNGGDYVLSVTSLESLPLSTTSPCDRESEPSEGDEFFVEDMDLFRSHIVLYERSRINGDQRLRVRRRSATDTNPASDGSDDTILELSSASQGDNTAARSCKVPLYWSKLSPVGNMCYESNFVRFELESPIEPGSVYQYNFDTQETTRVSGGERDGLNDDSYSLRFQKEKVVVKSSDGTGVPMSLFYKTGHEPQPNGGTSTSAATPIVLVGYGAYGEPMDLGYNPGWNPLLDRGAILAFAHTRGGGDLGRAWYAGGRKDRKARGIEDYEACALYLRKRFADRNHCSLVAKAFSAGGILVGAAVNRNPGLFDKVVLTNAFLDVSRTMERAELFLTEHEYDEFGNPSKDSVVDAIIRSYCPISNLDSKKQLQHTKTRFLVIGSLDDPNVPYWNATLYFRKLLLEGYSPPAESRKAPSSRYRSDNEREVTASDDRVFLELQLEGGHNFSSQNRIEVLALETAFILKEPG